MSNFVNFPLESLEGRGFNFVQIKEINELLPEGALIAGGCFESIIRGFSPKDIDIFFKNKESLKESVANLTNQGFKLIEDPKHLDDEEKRFVTIKKEGYPDLQLIKIRYYGSLKELLDTFDFTAAQIGFDKQELLMNEASLIDILRKRLVINKITYPSSTLRRMIKYSKKGYYICNGQFQFLVEEVSRSHRENPQNSQIFYVD